jgi:flagellar hook-associated protein FlgK
VDTREQTLEDLAGKANITTAANPDGSVNISIGGVAMVTGGDAVDSLQTYTDGNGQTWCRTRTAPRP